MANFVRELRLRSPVTVEFNDSIRDAVEKMFSEKTHSVLVKPYHNNGSWRIFTTLDQLKAESEGVDDTAPVGTHSNEIIHFVTPDASIKDCKAKMATFRIHHLPVFSDSRKSKPIGMVSQEDIR